MLTHLSNISARVNKISTKSSTLEVSIHYFMTKNVRFDMFKTTYVQCFPSKQLETLNLKQVFIVTSRFFWTVSKDLWFDFWSTIRENLNTNSNFKTQTGILDIFVHNCSVAHAAKNECFTYRFMQKLTDFITFRICCLRNIRNRLFVRL